VQPSRAARWRGRTGRFSQLEITMEEHSAWLTPAHIMGGSWWRLRAKPCQISHCKLIPLAPKAEPRHACAQAERAALAILKAGFSTHFCDVKAFEPGGDALLRGIMRCTDDEPAICSAQVSALAVRCQLP